MKRDYPNNLFLKAFGISPEEAKFARRGFRVTESGVVAHLETIGEKFLHGYHAALSAGDAFELAERLNRQIEPLYRGFAFEGAAMGLTLLDNLLPFRRKRLPEFIAEAAGGAHLYMSYVGAGWAFARIPWLRFNILQRISGYDSLLKWLILDGYGFHEGYFSPRRYFHSGNSLRKFPGYARHAFAQGLGRSLWFVEGAAVEKIAETLRRLPPDLHADLWSGVGLACAYAGWAEETEIKKLKDLADDYLPHLAQGAAFAAKARERAGNPAPHTEAACRVICGCSARHAASITDLKLKNLPAATTAADAEFPAYEVWRRRIQKEFLFEEATV